MGGQVRCVGTIIKRTTWIHAQGHCGREGTLRPPDTRNQGNDLDMLEKLRTFFSTFVATFNKLRTPRSLETLIIKAGACVYTVGPTLLASDGQPLLHLHVFRLCQVFFFFSEYYFSLIFLLGAFYYATTAGSLGRQLKCDNQSIKSINSCHLLV